MGLTGTLGSFFTSGLGRGGGLEGTDSTGGFLGFDGVLALAPLTGPFPCVPPPIFNLIVGRALVVGVDLRSGTCFASPLSETGPLSLAALTAGVAGGGGGGMEGWALLCDSTVLLMRAHSNQNIINEENES